MQNLRKVVVVLAAAVLVGVLFLFGIFCGFKAANFFGAASGPKTLPTPALLQQVQALSELTTVKYVIEKIEVLEVPSQNRVGQMIGSENRLLLLAHGVVKAGIDLGQIHPGDLKVSGKEISLK